MGDLDKRFHDSSDVPMMGDLMLQYAPFMKMYSDYISWSPGAMATISRWRSEGYVERRRSVVL